jgi:multidrug efflux pump subunit AcrA (membrane-fusion protein)
MKRKNLMNRKTILFTLLLVPLASLTLSCNKSPVTTPQPSSGKGQAVTVKVEQVRPQPISRVLETTGEVVATNTVVIAATIDGPISFCPYREGDWVRAGQKLIEIDRPLYREEVNSAAAALTVAQAKLDDLKAGSRPEEIAQAEETVKKLQEALAFAKTDMERIAKLVERGGLPGEAQEKARVTFVDLQSQLASAQQRLEMLKSGPTQTAIRVQEALVKEAEAKLNYSKAKLAEGVIVAPLSGVVTKVHVRRGDLATLKSPLIELSDPSSFVIRFGVPETESGAIFLSLAIQVTFDAYPGRSFRAKVVRVYPEIDRRTRNRLVEARVLDQVNIVPGMFARIKVMLETISDALVVPSGSILTTPSGEKIVMVVRDGKAARVKVSTGIIQGDRTQIISGIMAGDQVIVLGQEGLKDGAPVKIIGEGKPSPGEGNQKGETKLGEKSSALNDQKGGGKQ